MEQGQAGRAKGPRWSCSKSTRSASDCSWLGAGVISPCSTWPSTASYGLATWSGSRWAMSCTVTTR